MRAQAYRYCVVLLVLSPVLIAGFCGGSAQAATFQVNSATEANDFNPGDGVCSTDFIEGVCTLRAAIQEANALAGTDTITFNLGTGDPDLHLNSELPHITSPVILDGGTGGATYIELYGNNAGAASGLVLEATSIGSQIKSLIIRNFTHYGIVIRGNSNTVEHCYIVQNSLDGLVIDGGISNTIGGTAASARNVFVLNGGSGITIFGHTASSNRVQGNHIGTNDIGTADGGNITSGVRIDGAPNNTIGGTVAGMRNVISGNTQSGVLITGSTASGNRVQGNFIGTDVTGTVALANDQNGVRIDGAPDNTIGGTTVGARNVISGNASTGVLIVNSGATGNQLQGNFIGTNAAGTASLGNNASGISIQSASNNIVGGILAGARNIISGNNFNGVVIAAIANDATGNQIQGNFIGTSVTGTVDLGNNQSGIFISQASGNTVGGTTTVARNLISGNLLGVAIAGERSSGNRVQGNYIGTNAAGTAALGNSSDGVVLTNASNNTIGGTDADDGAVDGNVRARNIISGNGQIGVDINGGTATGNKVQGNFIGTNAAGTAALGNTINGVNIDGAPNNTIGGTAAGAGNLISANETTGINIRNTSGNLVQGNLIGTDATGTADLGNRLSGVLIGQAPDNTIGGTAPGARNVISGNNQHGIEIVGNMATGNLVQGNYIGTNLQGTAALGNRHGVLIIATSDNTIGGTAPGARNVISGNSENGVFILGGSNLVQGNFIGTNAAGTGALGNSLDGVRVLDASNNRIGGGAVGQGNRIAFNGSRGVNITISGGGTSLNNAILSNSIFSNAELGIDLNNDGITPNDALDADTGPNNLQNFPFIFAVVGSSASVAVEGTFTSTPGATFTLQFFSSAACDPSGRGEGQTYLGSLSVTANSSGFATYAGGWPVAVPPGRAVTATATNANNTSEFSECRAASAAEETNLRIDALSRRVGRTTGGQQLHLIGSFVGLQTVTIGGTQVPWSYSSPPNQITITTPQHAAGAVSIVLRSTTASVYTKTNAFAYLPVVFTDDPLVAGVTTAKAQHILELRRAVDAMREASGLGPAPWTDAVLVPTETTIRAVHIQELRSYLNNVLTRLGYAVFPYTDPSLTPGSLIKRIHIEELRQRIRAAAVL